MGDAEDASRRLFQTEEEIAEPLQTYFEFGRIAHEARGQKLDPSRGVRVSLVCVLKSSIIDFWRLCVSALENFVITH
jgi:hypothetical protein